MPNSKRIPGGDRADRDSDIPEVPTADLGNADAATHSARSIFLDASELAPEQREAFLQARCRNDQSLRRNVDALLKAHGLVGAFLGDPTQTAPSENETAGDRIGRYKIRERIGEGGCGVVYVAEQEEPVRRRVALKIIKLGMDTKSVIARFGAERQALAMMDHPNIAKVLDAGATETGRPYFVMELVRGIRITDYCDQNKLPTAARLDLFIKVCHAVQHAHQKGIIHRDLKPSNILVTLHDGVPVPKIIDFGIAKATEGRLTEQTVYTELHQFIGTPAYMSPEQAEMSGLDIDTRSDIYSLGVLLYELLTGQTPFDAKELLNAGLDAMRKTIREIEPPRPSTRLSNMRADLLTTAAARRGAEAPRLVNLIRDDVDWIVMKCLEKDRTRRYETANGLARDVARFLSDEPVEASPPSTTYRMRKFARKYRKPLRVVVAIAVILVGASVFSTWQAARAIRAEGEQRRLAQSESRQRVEAEEQRTLATTAAARERDAAQQAQQARDSAVQAKLGAILQLADNYTARGLESGNARLNGRSALWFANAAISSHDDPERVRANLIRVNNWLRGAWVPVAAVGQTDGNCDNGTFDPQNSRYLITCRRNGTVDVPAQIWDLATEQPLHWPADLGPLSDAAWVSGGKVLVGTSTGQVVLASMPELKALARWDAHGAVRRVAASANGRFVAAATGKTLIVWAASEQGEPAVVEHAQNIVYIGFSPSEEQLVTATDDDATARLFGIESKVNGALGLREVLAPVAHYYRGPKGASSDFFTRPPVFVQGGRQLVTIDDLGSAQQQGTMKWYDTASGAELAATQVTLTDLRGISVSPDGNILALATGNSTIFNTSTRQSSRITGNVLAQAFSPNGKYFAFSGIDLEIRKIDQNKFGSRSFAVLSKAGQAAFSNDGKYMAVLSGGLVQVLRMPEGSSDPISRRVALNGSSTWAAFSADGKYVAPIGKAGGSPLRIIQVSEAATGKPAGPAVTLKADLIAADFSSDGALIAAVTGIHDQEKQLCIWNWRTGAPACNPLALDSEPVWVAFAPDGRAVAVHFMNGKASLIDPTNGAVLVHVTCATPRDTPGTYPWTSGGRTIGFSRDGKTLFTWGARVVQAWDRTTGRERWAVNHLQNCWSLAESPDAKTIATGSFDGFLRFWNSLDGHEARPPIEHPTQVLTISFSPDGKLVGTACGDWQTRVWDMSTGKLVYAMASADYLTDIRFTPDSRFVVTADAVGLQVYDARTGDAVSPRCVTAVGAVPLLDISRDGHWATISAKNDFYCIVDLQKLTEVSKLSADEALRWTELLSNSRLSGSAITNLTGAQWMELWRKCKSDHPELREFPVDK